MLFPFTRAWTRRQKRLIVGSVVLALASFGALIYGMERYYRGPSEMVLCGKWQFDGLFHVEFSHNHSFSMFELEEPHSLIVKGRWHAGGKFLYLRFPASFRPGGNILEIWRIEDISAEEIRVR